MAYKVKFYKIFEKLSHFTINKMLTFDSVKLRLEGTILKLYGI